MTARAEAMANLEEGLRAVVRRVKRVIAERAAQVHPELQPASYLMLGWLAENGPARGSLLACEFNIDKGAISRQVQHLVELGLVEREADPVDGRAVLVKASAAGLELLGQAQADRRDMWESRLGDWSSEDLQEFATMLARFNKDLD